MKRKVSKMNHYLIGSICGRPLFLPLLIIVIIACLSQIAWGLTLELNPDLYIGPPGSIFTVTGTITNNAPYDMFAFGYGASVSPIEGLRCDEPVFFDIPLILKAGETFSGDLLNYIILSDSIPGTYPGNTYSVGYTTAGGYPDLIDVISDDFTVIVTPEPTTMLLLGSGLIGLAGYGRRKFFKK